MTIKVGINGFGRIGRNVLRSCLGNNQIEFVAVNIRGETARDVVRVPAASLTSRNQVWVVDEGAIRERQVDVVANEGGVAIVRNFDMAEGVVVVPPSNARNGLPVEVRSQQRVAGGAPLDVGAE